MRKYNINFKLLGIMGLAANLLAAAFPIEPHSAFAANGYEVPLRDKIDVQSTVTLTMDAKPANEDANLNASGGIDPDDSGKVIRRTASIELGNTNGFTVSISGNSNLVGKNSANTLPSVSTTTTLGQMNNSWGWVGSVDDDINDCNPATLSFKGMATSEQQLGSGGAVSSGTKKVTMCFGARVNGEKPADIYSNTVTLSVVAQPGQVGTFNGITKMQEMTPEICRAAKVNDTAQLEDVRDGKKYWVTKLLDGNCWMSQNLALDLSTSTALTPATSDVSSNWTPKETTSSDVTLDVMADGVTNFHEENSWKLGTYLLLTPTGANECSNKTGLSACSGFMNMDGWTASTDPNFYATTDYEGTDHSTNCTKPKNSVVNSAATGNCRVYDAHYLVGNYYFWEAATAGSGGSTGRYGTAASSVCPKNWKLPDSEYNNGGIKYPGNGDFRYLLQQYGLASESGNGVPSGTSSVNQLSYSTSYSPLFLVKAGSVGEMGTNDEDFSIYIPGLYNAGSVGQYWTSRRFYDTFDVSSNGYAAAFISSKVDSRFGVFASNDTANSLRCLVSTQ